MDDLLPRIATGDQSAVPLCLDRYGNLVWSLARRMAGTHAEDAVQEIFVKLWQQAARFDPALGKEITFVALIARRHLIDYLRKHQPMNRLEPLPDSLTATAPSAENKLFVKEQFAQVESALAELRPEERQLLQLSLRDGLTHEAIQSKTGLPLGTVKTHLRRGLIRLRELLTERGAS